MDDPNQNQPFDPPQAPPSSSVNPPPLPSAPSAPSRPPVETLEEKMQKVLREEAYLSGVETQLKAVQESTRTTFPIFAPMHDYLRRRFKPYQKWHLNPHFNQVNVGILIAYTFLIGFFVANQIGIIGPKARTRAAAGIAKVVNYQGKLTDTSDVPVADGSYNIKFVIYDAESGGTCLYAARGTCGSPAAKSITVTKGIFSTLLGESGDNVMNLDFNTDLLFLGVTIGSDSEMTPRKRIGSVGYAFNADTVDGAHAGAGAGNVLKLDSSGNIVIAGGATLDTNTFVVDAAGNKVGIGTTSPTTFNLQVAGSVGPNADAATDLGSSALRWRDLYLGPTSLHLVSTTSETTTARDWKVNIQTTAGASQGNLRVLEGANEIVNIAPGGNVGIGAAVPGQKLSVAGTLGIIETGASPTYYTIFQGGDQAADLTYTLPTGYPAADGYVLSSTTAGVMSWVAGGAAAGGWTDDGTVVRLTTITDSVGIGTAVPGDKLHVQVSTANTGLRVTGSGAGGVLIQTDGTGASNGYVDLYSSAGNLQTHIPASGNTYFNNGGNVGIGTTSPNSLLELSKSNDGAATALRVTNSFSSTGSTDETADIDFYQGSGGNYFTSGRIRSFREGDYLTSNTQLSGGLSFWTQTPNAVPATGWTEKMRITAAGNVGIGTTSPGFKLVAGGTSSANVPATSGSTDSSQIARIYATNVGGGGGGVGLDFGVGNLNGSSWIQARSGDNFATNYSLLLNPNGGNVGIGTTSPGEKLEVFGRVIINGDYGDIRTDAASPFTSTGVQLKAEAAKPFVVVQLGTSDSASAFRVYDSSATGIFHVGADGNVGIGTTSPGNKFEIYGDAIYQSMKHPTASSYIGFLFNEGTTVKGYMQTIGSTFSDATRRNDLEISSVSGEVVLQKDGGNVLVGTSSSSGDFSFQVANSSHQYMGLFMNTAQNVNYWGIQVSNGTSAVSTWGLINFTRQSDGAQVGSITHNGTNTSYNTSSDQRLKKDIIDTQRSLNDLMRIKVRDFKFKSDDNNRTFTGYIAQELAPVFPDAVSIPADPNQYWGVDYGKLTPLLVKSIQDQQAEIDGLKTKDDNLQNQINLLQSNISSGITTNNLVVNNSAQFNSFLIVRGAAEFQGTLLVKQAATFEGELLAKEAVTFEKTLLVKDTATFEKDLIVKGNLVLADNNKGINLVIPANSLTHSVVFTAPQPDEKYAVSISPSWNTNYWITNKTPAGFSINFSSKPLIDSMLDWVVMR